MSATISRTDWIRSGWKLIWIVLGFGAGVLWILFLVPEQPAKELRYSSFVVRQSDLFILGGMAIFAATIVAVAWRGVPRPIVWLLATLGVLMFAWILYGLVAKPWCV